MTHDLHDFEYIYDGIRAISVTACIEHSEVGKNAVSGIMEYDDSVSDIVAEDEDGEDVTVALSRIFVCPFGEMEMISIAHDIKKKALKSWLNS